MSFGTSRVELVSLGKKEFEEVIIDGDYGPRRYTVTASSTGAHFDYAMWDTKRMGLGNINLAHCKRWWNLTATEKESVLYLTARHNKRIRENYGGEPWFTATATLQEASAALEG